MGQRSRLLGLKPLRIEYVPPTGNSLVMGSRAIHDSCYFCHITTFLSTASLTVSICINSLLIVIIHPQSIRGSWDNCVCDLQAKSSAGSGHSLFDAGGNKHTICGRAELGYKNTTCRYYYQEVQREEGRVSDQEGTARVGMVGVEAMGGWVIYDE